MKKILFLFLLVMMGFCSHAQQVSVRLSFPVGVRVGSPGPAPYRGAIWIGPEWQWRGGHYVTVPGYWGRPPRNRAIWVPGHWKHWGRGYRWIPGHWK